MEFFIEALKFGGILFLVILTIAAFFHFAYLLAGLFHSVLSRLYRRLQAKIRRCS